MATRPLRLRKGDAALVYSLSTGRVRRWLVPDADGNVDAGLSAGEAVLRVPRGHGGALPLMQAHATANGGRTPLADRYVMVDRRTSCIVGAVICDPACGDRVPGVFLVQHDTADASWGFAWTKDGATFTAPPTPQYTQEEADAFAVRHGGG